MRFPGVLAGAFLLLHPAAICAQTVWDMPTEYPANAMPGVGLTAFAKHVAEHSAGKLTISRRRHPRAFCSRVQARRNAAASATITQAIA